MISMFMSNLQKSAFSSGELMVLDLLPLTILLALAGLFTTYHMIKQEGKDRQMEDEREEWIRERQEKLAEQFNHNQGANISAVRNTAEKGDEIMKQAMAKLTAFLGKHRTMLIIVAVAVAAFAFVDIPQTVRLKAYVARMLLDEDSARKAVSNLCQAAHSGTNGFVQCFMAFSGDK